MTDHHHDFTIAPRPVMLEDGDLRQRCGLRDV